MPSGRAPAVTTVSPRMVKSDAFETALVGVKRSTATLSSGGTRTSRVPSNVDSSPAGRVHRPPEAPTAASVFHAVPAA